MKLNDVFDKVYCINLDRRIDRWEKSKEIFDAHSIEVERFSAIEPESRNQHLLKGELGILRSNLQLIQKAVDNKYDNIFIFEDDVEFHSNFCSLFESYMAQVPDNWDMIYFGANHVKPHKKLSNNVVKLNGSYAIHSIAIKSTLFDTILNTLPKEEKAVDVYYAELHKSHNVYCFRPHLTWQREGFSDIQQGHINYDFLRK